MRFSKAFALVPGIFLGSLVLLPLSGCSQSGPGTSGKTGGSTGNGGTSSSGGATTSGGATSAGGSTGAGGATPSGGATNQGGTTSSGGVTGAGGGSVMGGTKGSGGATGSGGAMNLDAATNTGGTTSKDAAGTGGGPASGGIVASGGAMATGGIVITGDGGFGRGGSTSGTGGVVGTGGSSTCAPPTVTLTGTDAVAGKLIQFNDNGGWCWYQDERAVVDTKGGKLVIGSVAGTGSRVGNIEAVIYDLAAGTKSGPTKLGNLSVDDHDAPAINIRPDGKYVALWATHRTDCNTYYSIFDGSKWAAQSTFDWKSAGCPWDSDNTHMITYNNLWYMGTTLYDLSRSVGTSPNLISSTDDGATWAYYGRLTYTPLTGYVAGYYKYWGNNTDRIDFLGTEAHPRDNDNSLWHGYMKDGKIYNSAGTVVDDALAGTSATSSAQNIDKYTQVFKTGASVGGTKLCRMWNHDIVRYADGTVAILGQGRADNCTGTPSASDPDKRMIYSRWDGTSWKTTYLAKAGPKLYADEQDYTGLGALVPDDPTTIYISTTYDPTTDTMKSGAKHEIWRGTTCDNGATFKWTPVTANSTKDNVRPIVPKWDASHTALLWMQGTYTSAQSYSMAVVGTVSGM